jgi:hypothetical protein
MVKNTLLIWAIALVIISNVFVHAESSDTIRHDSRHVIRRTAGIVRAAQQHCIKASQYTGLRRAVAHHLLSRKLYRQYQYEEGIYHSLRARYLAIQILKGNPKFKDVWQDAIYDRVEKMYVRQSPSDLELDQLVAEEEQTIESDEAAAMITIGRKKS